ncbi:MAG: hypothetical protein E6G04_09475 [Actinobacteria bacterium]|nr:MAG: hypothetical protein E6G04_09475 [Actinomycetota bacterium]
MIRTVARVVGIAVLTVGVLAPAVAAPHKSSGSGSTPCNDGTVSWSPTTLWPPNHKMQTITIGYTDNDNDGDMIGVMVGSIHDNQSSADGSNELNGSGQPTDKQGLDWSGSGNMGMSTDPGTATTTAQVRAERSGRDKGGRVYTIAVTCSDMGGSNMEMQMQTVNITVTVPHDQGH